MRSLLGLVTCVALLGCNFDDKFLEDVSTPAAVVLENTSEQGARVDALYSAPGATSVFSFNGKELAPGEQSTLRIPEEPFEAIVAKQFVLEGECPDGTQWRRAGTDPKLRIDRDPRILEVTIRIQECG